MVLYITKYHFNRTFFFNTMNTDANFCSTIK